MSSFDELLDPTRLEPLVRPLMATGDGAPSLAEKLERLSGLRTRSRQLSHRLDELLLAEQDRLAGCLIKVQRKQNELQELLQRLTAPPWHTAVFLGKGPPESRHAYSAVVAHQNATRVVNVISDLELEALRVGEQVLLGPELNVVVGTLPRELLASGETAAFDRWLPDQRMILRARDEEIVVRAAEGLSWRGIESGDLVRWDRQLGLAFERLERSSGEQLFLEETPSESFAAVGGLDAQIEQIQRAIRLHFEQAGLVRKYRLRRKGSVLLAGPPGTGKTLLARALANWLG